MVYLSCQRFIRNIKKELKYTLPFKFERLVYDNRPENRLYLSNKSSRSHFCEKM
jgi:hypothetical protein